MYSSVACKHIQMAGSVVNPLPPDDHRDIIDDEKLEVKVSMPDIETADFDEDEDGGEYDETAVAHVKGAFLTWEDVWVSVGDGSKGSKSILKGLTGFARPGQLLAVMGPSGSGKSTLLDALAGRLGSKSKQSGEILINGRPQQLAYGASAYVTQDDVLTWTLTTREAVYYSAQLQLPSTMPRSEKRARAERTIREMGLQGCIDTRIGGCGSKGLSSGQQRRVSICIEILTRPQLLFLDEPTSGLDSAASYYVMDRILKLAREYGMTVLASMHQPSPDIFKLVHNLCLLSMGRTVYFGPTFAVNQFFSTSGFPCPNFLNPADHCVRMINTDFNEDIEPSIQLEGNTTTMEVLDQLVDSYRSSDTYSLILTEMACINAQRIGALQKQRNRASFFTQCIVLTERSFINMYRDLGYYWLRLAIYIFMAFGLGTVFYNVGNNYNSINARGSMIMFVISLLTLMSIGAFPSFVEEMKVFRRERLNGHYGVAAFVIGNTFSSSLFLILIAAIPGTIAYYLVGLQQGTERVAYFIVVILVSITLVEGLMMIVATLVPNFLMGIMIGAGLQAVMTLSGGFFRLPDDLPRIFWKYPMYYVSFHRYGFQGLYKNEFEGLRFPMSILGMARTVESSSSSSSSWIDGETVLRDVWQVEMRYSKWIDLIILAGMAVSYRVLFFLIIKITERMKPTIRRFYSGISHEKE